MTDALPGLPGDLMPLFTEVVGREDPALLQSILRTARPNMEERERVEDILADEFSACLRPDSEPTERGKRVDDLLGKFLMQFPIERG